ncbi:calcitonin gene-related peptide 2-like isoform X1 [Psammomys obesus]|uniref:calcitonin gene-related peptide 2-like isoform X1 n=1 Tax=Psammomys obesus TaxID=48139 RepID=UPI002452C214|nr:calcitonin gene-related peptide 2-like isoform X1 [Psammomys obesus]
MGFWKFFPCLALSSIWVLCLVSSLQASPFRSALESSLDLATLSKEEKHLLATLLQNYEQMKARKLVQKEQEAEGSSYRNKRQAGTSETKLQILLLASKSNTAQKRSCNTATCVTHRLAGLLSRSGGVVKENFVPTDVGSKAFGRRRRDLQA